MFRKLTYQPPNVFSINSRKPFAGEIIVSSHVEAAFEFAYSMTFGREGHHRKSRTGGQIVRRFGEQFTNTFQGKLAEFGVYQKFQAHGIILPTPDVNLMGEGLWDDSDFTLGDKKFCVKSSSFFSNLLLLESRDWNDQGLYVPNIEAGNSLYDYFILCRVNPDGKQLMQKNRLFYSDSAEKGSLENLIMSNRWSIDFPGYITRSDLQQIISNGLVLPQNARLNGSTAMDAENYYCQCGDLRPITSLIDILSDHAVL